MIKLSPGRIVTVFVLLSGLWIAFSDILLLRIVSDPQLITEVSIAKGFLFIAVTAVFLFTLISRYASQRDSSEINLRESRAMIAHILDTIPQSVFWKDHNSVYLGCNSVFSRAAGLENPEQIIGKTDFDLPWPREEAEAYRTDDREVIENNRPKFHIIEPLEQADGTRLWIDTTKLPLTDENGRVCGILGVYEDITDRKRAEEQLRESEEHYHSLFHNMLNGLAYCKMIFDQGRPQDFIYLQVNAAFESLTGLKNVVGKKVSEVIPGIRESDAELFEIYGRVALTGKPETFERYVEALKMWFSLSVYSPRKGYFVAVFDVITDRKKLEEQLRQSHKMESIGTLAGGVAHDFNNILAAIVGYGNIMQMKMRSDDPLREYLSQILTSAERAASLTQSLLAFSRKQVISPRNIDLNKSIRKVEKFLTRTIGEDIVLSTSLSDETLMIFIDPTQIEQVLMNLATNARDAMPKGGRLLIETGRVMLGNEYVLSHGFGLPGSYAVMTVSDTGEGMDEQTQHKIFDPFFTTKELGRGTGLGLAIVYGIVKQNNGYINVYSEVGKGTTFKIYLPFVSSRAEESKNLDVPPLRRGTETILLAEDDESVRLLNKGVLQEFGYTVIEAADGEEALQKFRAHRERINLLILDVVMPKKNGREVFEEAKRGNPYVKVIFTSGYPADLIQKEGVLEKGLHFLSKPSSPQALLRTVREVLDQ